MDIPQSHNTVKVSIIDTSFNADLPVSTFMGPEIKGFDRFHVVAYAFLVAHEDSEGKKRKIVFDLGYPKDSDNDFPPFMSKAINEYDIHMTAEKYVSEILTENGVALEDIEAVIWSHSDPDHIGRPSLFPSSTALVVGPSIKKAYFPGYPEIEISPVLAREFAGREVRELDFSASSLTVGGLKALDYFGDGSFYLLSAPGHSLGHINALARTTGDSFLYFAGDTYYHSSALRPHAGARLPSQVDVPGLCCSGKAFHTIHPVAGNADALGHYGKAIGNLGDDPKKTPFQTISETPSGGAVASYNLQEARDTILAVQKFDSRPDVLLIAAHDNSLRNIIDVFPQEANDWLAKGWKQRGSWLFLADFAKALELAETSHATKT